MIRLLCINGLGGAGKDTTGQALLSTIPNSALLDIKSLSRTNPWEFHEYATGLQNMAMLIQNYINAGFSTIICSGGISSQERLDYLQNLIDTKTIYTYIFWLDVKKEIRDMRRVQRKRDDADKIEHLEYIDSVFTDPNTLQVQNGTFVRIKADTLTTKNIVEFITNAVLVAK